ncbi:tetratricopeptide repeat protein [Dethiobacter alkaliphilus]|uniref:TPR repeat-containing protein n=1 Tax=Dethiobacter alkaliphilus AHT 1 TaxID=555088 RepID=C0GF37_DETAL|nr:tetratricopeptide repeat protein [Dethiobacter alkaliphilus]EEG78219.1 TPR repeat-containing protein [Dethiobacter alkaliphilus AHT 1]
MSNNQMVSTAADFYRDEMLKQRPNPKVSATKAWITIVITFMFANVILYGIGQLFFWDRYSADPYYIQQFEALRQRVAQDPDNVENHVNLGWAYFQKDDLNQALAHFDKAASLDDNYFPAFFHRGLTYMQMERYDLAVRSFTTAVSLAPRDHVSQLNLGIAYARQNQFERAHEALSAAYLLNPRSTELLIELGFVYEQLGDLDKAIESYQGVIAFDPNNTEARTALENLGQ